MLLKDKVGIVTGAGTGIGRACSIRFAREGAKLALLDISDSQLSETKALIAAENSEAKVICLNVDISDEESVKMAMENTIAEYGKLNFAMNNAGVMMTRAPVGEVDCKAWERVVRINLFGSFYCAKYEIQQMLKNDEPSSIIFTSSVGGLIGTPSASDYVCSKHAIIGLAKSIVCDYADKGIRANAICPGQVATPMWESVNGRVRNDPEAYAKLNRTQNPMRRLALPEEIASVAAFLAAEESSHITGVALPVDGGHLATNAAYFNWE
ncbi:NAD(P)-dependent dehydrogenase, short-chain alcohol dehydrogenase family [Sporobacter termitidis DSM 10068]|uniref:NAD(P)-dependent dehydrogenase, short-chain alcohol dehydrogenase family n=1 Tax=Sporobacter termitidis DSM 10068 TaxID=1123282 RepID=A0A1M5YQU3_9FIRM|nr:SDR family oxidoreductase [Sporobacter termitidis]SHI14487.1 NAD(P)-dependent dehydrogenase, short-chain alcohol dehydrogenase family [Sporobacter termitidis DSM 10068]